MLIAGTYFVTEALKQKQIPQSRCHETISSLLALHITKPLEGEKSMIFKGTKASLFITEEEDPMETHT